MSASLSTCGSDNTFENKDMLKWRKACFCVQAGVARVQKCRSTITPGCTSQATTCAGSSPSHCCLCTCARSQRESSPIRGFQFICVFMTDRYAFLFMSLCMNGLFQADGVQSFAPLHASADGLHSGHDISRILSQYRNSQFPQTAAW